MNISKKSIDEIIWIRFIDYFHKNNFRKHKMNLPKGILSKENSLKDDKYTNEIFDIE